MSKLNRFQKIVVGVIVFLIGLGVILKSVTGSITSNLGYDGISMLKYALIDFPVKTLKDWTSDFSNLWSAKEENDQLRYELSQQPYLKAQLDEANRKIAEQEDMLALVHSSDQYQQTVANVIGRDQSYWNNQLTIDKGSKDGLAVGMAVTSTKGVVGKIKSVSQHTSVVKLLTSEDKQNTASIQISVNDKTSLEGILESYDAKRERYIVLLFDDSDEIEKGMQVVTSGKGGTYPAGLLIGTVESVQALNNQIGQTVYVKPIDDFQKFDIVSVIGKEKSK